MTDTADGPDTQYFIPTGKHLPHYVHIYIGPSDWLLELEVYFCIFYVCKYCIYKININVSTLCLHRTSIVFRSENIKTQWSVSLADSRTTGSGKLIVIILAAKAKSK